MKGFSLRNLKYMRRFAQAWPEAEFVQAVLAQLPWYHHLALLDKLTTAAQKALVCRPGYATPLVTQRAGDAN